MREEAFDWEGWLRVARPLLFPVGPDAPVAADVLEASLRAIMPLDLGPRLALPSMFVELMARMGARAWRSQRIAWDFSLYSAASVVSEARYNSSEDDPEHVRKIGPWIAIGCERSHDQFFLCCERESPKFGTIAVGEDSHPWLPDGYYPVEMTLREWIATRFVHARDRGWILLPLTREERAAIDAASGWDLLVAARDITAPYDASNDVWSGAPADRMRRTSIGPSEMLPPEAAGARSLYEDRSAFVGLLDRGPAGTLVVGDRLPADAEA